MYWRRPTNHGEVIVMLLVEYWISLRLMIPEQ